jgi:hypothetical protein
MVLVEVDAVVVLTTSITATGLVLLMLANAPITAERATALVAGLPQTGRHGPRKAFVRRMVETRDKRTKALNLSQKSSCCFTRFS